MMAQASFRAFPLDGERLDRGAVVKRRSPLPFSFPVEGKESDQVGLGYEKPRESE